MKSVVALATVFAVGALSVPNAHGHHEHLHHRHAEPQDVQYVTQMATNTVVKYVDQNGNAVAAPAAQTPAPAAPVAPAPPAGGDQQFNPQGYGGGNPKGQFKTVVTADDGQQVTANAWQWGNPNGQHGYSWTYQQPGKSQQTQAPASQAPAQYSQPAQASQPAQYSQPAAQPSSAAPAKQSSPAAKPSSAAPAQPSGNTGSNDFQKKIVDAHNLHRANHSVPALQWHDGLASAAQMVANKCSFTHDTKTGKDQCGFDGYGQNFACVGGSATEDPTKDISGQWYGEEGIYEQTGSYGKSNPIESGSGETGHFTQVVWKSTTHVGCAMANCPNGVSGTSGMDSLFVCDYGPAGNMGGEYADNVPKPKGDAPAPGSGSY